MEKIFSVKLEWNTLRNKHKLHRLSGCALNLFEICGSASLLEDSSRVVPCSCSKYTKAIT